ncbi:hypothetical protein SAMN05216376_101198 [Mameliella alba]|nr:hypothetical protein LX94_00198 [Mameliella alba]SDC04625.1 hypothetical protein SAMN05216376_101198 [Mameliella alba]
MRRAHAMPIAHKAGGLGKELRAAAFHDPVRLGYRLDKLGG